MARKKRTPEENARREKIRELLQMANIGSMDDIQSLFKETIAEFMENGLDAELDDELGYSRYDYKNKDTDNSRNGHSSKTLRTSFGDVEISVPRDRKGEFEPHVLKKNQTSISQDIEENILSMYAKGMTTSDIETHIQDIYGVEVSDTTVSRITDKILPIAKEWQQRPLESVYAVVFMDAIHYHARSEGQIVKKAVYAAVDEAAALDALDAFSERWDKKYPKIAPSWRENWSNLSTYFKYPQEVRRLIYTTNAIEGFNRQLRKVTKAKSVFPTDDSLLKMLYLAMMDITKKWTGRRQDWSVIHAQLAVFFADRMPD